MIVPKPYFNLLITCIIFLFVINLFIGCGTSGDPEPAFDCNLSTLTLNVGSVTPASACSARDGAATLEASGSEGTVQFSLNGRDFQASPTFSGLAAGQYSVVVKDENNCENSGFVTIPAEGSNLSISGISIQPAGCDDNNGTIEIDGTGTGNVMYKLDNGSFQASNVFNNLTARDYKVTLKDETDCEISSQQKVPHGTSYQQQVKNIISTNCAISGCHDGTNGTGLNWKMLANVQNNAQNIKTQTQSGNMPPEGRTITSAEKALIACWVDDGAPNN